MLKSKETWRWHMQQKRLVLSKEALVQAEQHLCNQLQKHTNWSTWQRIGAYYPHGNECSLLATCHRAIAMEKDVFLPCIEDQRSLTWRRYDSHQILTPNHWGILEPLGGNLIEPDQLDVMLVPGLAFSIKGERLGHGQGFYDHIIQQNPSLATIGIAYDFQIIENMPTDPWDELVDEVLIVKTDE